jgi:hypothetical protein
MMTTHDKPSDRVEADKAWRTFRHWLFRECNEGTRRHLWAAFQLPTDEIRNHGDEQHALTYVRKKMLADQQAEIERLKADWEAQTKEVQAYIVDELMKAARLRTRAEQAEAQLAAMQAR